MNNIFTLRDLLILLEKLIKENPERKDYKLCIIDDGIYDYDIELINANDENKTIYL